VWKCRYNDKDIAAKALKVYSTSDFKQIRKVGCPQTAVFINELTVSYAAVLQRGHDLEHTSPSERAATVICDNDRESVRDGIRMDEEWDHQ